MRYDEAPCTLRCCCSVLALAAAMLFPAPPVQAGQPASVTAPWGPLYLLDRTTVGSDVAVATTGRGMNVVAWRERRSDGSYQTTAAVQVSRGTWSSPVQVTGSGRPRGARNSLTGRLGAGQNLFTGGSTARADDPPRLRATPSGRLRSYQA